MRFTIPVDLQHIEYVTAKVESPRALHVVDFFGFADTEAPIGIIPCSSHLRHGRTEGKVLIQSHSNGRSGTSRFPRIATFTEVGAAHVDPYRLSEILPTGVTIDLNDRR